MFDSRQYLEPPDGRNSASLRGMARREAEVMILSHIKSRSVILCPAEKLLPADGMSTPGTPLGTLPFSHSLVRAIPTELPGSSSFSAFFLVCFWWPWQLRRGLVILCRLFLSWGLFDVFLMVSPGLRVLERKRTEVKFFCHYIREYVISTWYHLLWSTQLLV